MGKRDANLRLTYVIPVSTFIAWKIPIAVIATALFHQVMDLIFLNMLLNVGTSYPKIFVFWILLFL
jgi:hypothetical protein